MVKLSRPPCVSPGCPRLSRMFDMGRETFCLPSTVKHLKHEGFGVLGAGTDLQGCAGCRS